MRNERNKRRRRPLAGRHLVTLGAVALLALSGYELWIRLEDFWAWTAGVRHLSAVRGTPFIQDLGIVFEAPEMRALGYKLIFLCFCLLFALICVIRRSRARGGWLIMLLDAAVAGAGVYLGIYGIRPSDWATTLKLVPLLLIFVGCVVNYAHRAVRRRRRRARETERADAERREAERGEAA